MPMCWIQTQLAYLVSTFLPWNQIAHDENLILEDTQDEAIEMHESIKPNLQGKQICKKVAPHVTMVKNEYVVEKGNEG